MRNISVIAVVAALISVPAVSFGKTRCMTRRMDVEVSPTHYPSYLAYLKDRNPWEFEASEQQALTEEKARRLVCVRQGKNKCADDTAFALRYQSTESDVVIPHVRGRGVTVIPEIASTGGVCVVSTVTVGEPESGLVEINVDSNQLGTCPRHYRDDPDMQGGGTTYLYDRLSKSFLVVITTDSDSAGVDVDGDKVSAFCRRNKTKRWSLKKLRRRHGYPPKLKRKSKVNNGKRGAHRPIKSRHSQAVLLSA